jgi:hypothetical protein
VLEHMRRVGGFGEILEDHVEKSHHDMDKFHQRAARLRSPEMRAFSFSHHEKTGNTPDVIAAGKKSMEMKSASGQSLVQLVQVWGKFWSKFGGSSFKAARNTKRSDNHAAEQMRPAGKKVQPHDS